MPSLLERLLGDATPDEQVDLEARQSDANDALQDRVDADAYGIEGCGKAESSSNLDDGPVSSDLPQQTSHLPEKNSPQVS